MNNVTKYYCHVQLSWWYWIHKPSTATGTGNTQNPSGLPAISLTDFPSILANCSQISGKRSEKSFDNPFTSYWSSPISRTTDNAKFKFALWALKQQLALKGKRFLELFLFSLKHYCTVHLEIHYWQFSQCVVEFLAGGGIDQ